MAESLLHYVGLQPGQSSWYWHKGGRDSQVPVLPSEWVRLNLSRHPEVLPAIQAGTAVIEESAPPDTEILDETTKANREYNWYGKQFPNQPKKRQHSRGQSEVYTLTVEQLGVAVRCFTPWPGWEVELDRVCAFSENRPHLRGARPNVRLPMPFDNNFAVLHRIAVLITRKFIEDIKKAREGQIELSWESGQYDSKKVLRKIYKRRMPLPSRREALGELLQLWHVWEGQRAPSSKTLRRYRAALGADRPLRAYLDDQILEVIKSPRQRIILGSNRLSIGTYAPGGAASPALLDVGPSFGPMVLDITPSYEASRSVSD